MKQVLLLLFWLFGVSAIAREIHSSNIEDNLNVGNTTINSLDDASFSYASTSYCQDGTDPSPTVTTPGGTFSSTAGLSLNTTSGEIDLDVSTPGTYTITYTTTVPPDSRTFDVTITAVEDASFSYGSADYCSDDSDPTPTATTPGGTFSSTAGLQIDSSTGEIDLDASTPGTYTITYTTAGPCSASSTFDITINTRDDASFSYASSSYCQDSANPLPSIATPGGTFSSTLGIVLDPATGEIDLSVSTTGTYTITYAVAGACPDSETFDITINPMDDAGFTYTFPTYCPTDTDPTPSVNTGGGAFTASAGLMIDGSTGEIDLSASTPGDHTVTYTTSGTCPNSSTFDVAILDDGAPLAQPAADITCDAFTATWNPVFGATDYEVDVAEDAAFTILVAGYNSASTTDTFLNVTGLTATQTYYYQVRSVTSCGTSVNSDTIPVEVMDIPAAVSNLTASNPDCDGFNVSWDAVTYASSYLLEVSQDGFTTIELSQSIPSTSLSLAGLDQGTAYEYRVTPQNVCGSGSASTGAYQTNDVPVIPTGVASSQVVCDGAMITWDEVVEADQYLVEISADTFATIASYPISNDTLVVSGLVSATTYAYRIIPGNSCGTGDTTTVLTFTTDSLPSAPVDTLLSVEHNRATVAWDTIVNADTYSMEVATDLLFSSLVGTITMDSTTAEVKDLVPLTTYYLRIFADNTCGNGPYSDTLTFTTPQDPLVIDSLALVDLYNATDGPNWADNTNWLSGDITTWQGVTVANNRVARQDLGNNQLSGAFPVTMDSLTGLDYANFRDNALSGTVGSWISNFSEATDSLLISNNQLSEIAASIAHTAGIIDLANNQFTFEDLLPVVDSLPQLSYAPQAVIGSVTNTFRDAGESYTLVLNIDDTVTTNQYVWFRDGVVVDTSSVGQYAMDTIVVSDDGVYTCEVTNTNAPDLTLVSEPMTVNVLALPNSITFPEIADVEYGDDPFVLNASTSSGLPVFFEAIEGDSLVEVVGDVVTPVGIGQVTIRAAEPGGDCHGAASSLTQQFTINQGTQTIAFTAIEDQDIFVTDSIALSISASSGLPVDLTIDGPAELDGEVLWLLDTGTVSVVAFQSGNEFYQQALPVSQSFLVFTSDTIPVVVEPPVDSTIDYTITVKIPSASLSATASLHKASGSSFITEKEQPLISGSSAFTKVPGGYYSVRLNPTNDNYLPTYTGGYLTLAQANILGLTQDTTVNVSIIAKPDTAKQQGITVGGTLKLESTSGGRLTEETAMPSVAVYLVQKSDQALVGYGFTNTQGVFSFPNIPAGDYYFLADYEGIDFLDNEIEVTDKSLTLDVAVGELITIRSIREEIPPALITSIGRELDVNFTAYPNPATDRLTVVIPAGWNAASVTVLNTIGQTIISQTANGGKNNISLRSLPSGLYYVRVRQGGDSHLLRIVKQ
ncbi:MAG: fibronectin type III domain-containing protein [Cyclobacteriaceae bacterium]